MPGRNLINMQEAHWSEHYVRTFTVSNLRPRIWLTKACLQLLEAMYNLDNQIRGLARRGHTAYNAAAAFQQSLWTKMTWEPEWATPDRDAVGEQIRAFDHALHQAVNRGPQEVMNMLVSRYAKIGCKKAEVGRCLTGLGTAAWT